MSLYHTHRPKTLEQIRGNKETVSALQGFLLTPEKMPHVYLFYGPTGCGKTTFGRIIGNTLEVAKEDIIEMDSAQFNGIDTIREMRKNSAYKPLRSKYRIYILDEVHMFTTAAQEGMLKILEDTPRHVIFILCTTNPEKLKSTIRGRCQQFQVKPLSDDEMQKLLKQTIRKEKDSIEAEVLSQIIQDAQGHSRQALQILEQVLNTEPEKRLEAAKQAEIETSQSIELCRALLGKSNWKQVSIILTGLKGQDPEGIRRHVLGYAQAVLLKSDNEKAGLVLEEFLEPTYNSGYPQLVFACYSVTKNS